MADRQLKVTVVGDTKNLERSLGRAEKKLDKFGRNSFRGAVAGSGAFHGLGRSVAFASSAFLGGAGLTYAIKSTISAAMESQRVLAQTRNAVEQGGKSWKQYGAQIDRTITAQSQLSGFDDEQMMQTFQNLFRSTGNVTKALRLNALAADVARGRNIDLEAAQQIVTKASIGQIGALRRLGINIDKNATAVEALDLLQQKYAGSAVTYGKTAAGAFDRFNVAVENVQETLGNAFLPMLTKVTNQANKWLNNAANQKKISDDAEKTAEVFGRVADHLGDVKDTLSAIVNLDFNKPPRWLDDMDRDFRRKADDWKHQINLLPGVPLFRSGGAGSLDRPGGGGDFTALRPDNRAGPFGPGTAGSGIPGSVSGRAGRVLPGLVNSAVPFREFQIALAEATKQRKDDEQILRVTLAALRQRMGRARSLAAKTEIQRSINTYQNQLAGLLDQDAQALKDAAAAAKAARKKIIDAKKKALATFKRQADDIKSAVLDALGNKENRIDNARALADAKASLRVARHIGGPEGIKLAGRDVVDAQLAIQRQKIEETKFAVTGGKGGPTLAAGGVTINIHGITDPDRVAQRVIAELNRRGRHSSPQSRGRSPGVHGI